MDIPNQHSYVPEYIPSKSFEENAWAILLFGKKILMKKLESQYYLPTVDEVINIAIEIDEMEYIGRYDEYGCYCIRLEEAPELSGEFELVDMMDITRLTGDSGLFSIAGTANHILHWKHVNRYCGLCGNEMINKNDERAKLCPSCKNIVYPRISPAVITAVFHKDKILLAHNSNFRTGLYSLIAGFVEPGETLEQCVEREIREEVGIKVKNIKYFSSQPWSFPDSLMLAFTAEYESGEIETDNYEITDAGWYQAEHLPDIPSTDSIAGKIIRWYRDKEKLHYDTNEAENTDIG